MINLRTLLQTIRPPFLILSPICVLLGASTAITATGTIDTTSLILIITAALCAHVSVNTLNEYTDFKSGLDLETIRTPFSGGSGALPANPAMANMVLATGLITLSVTCAIGLYFLNSYGALVLPVGIIGVVIILTYSRWINRWPLLCLVAPGLGFGILMVVGTYIVLTGKSAAAAWFAAMVPFFLVNNLLLLNQFPDIEADKNIGRYHLPIAYGTKASSYVYGIFFVCAYATIVLGIYYGYFPMLSLIALLPVALSIYSMRGALKYAGSIGSHPQYLGANVAATLLAPMLLSVSVLYG